MHENLIDIMISDFKDFFITTKFSKFIRYKWIDNMEGGMKARRMGANSYIAISTDIKYVDIEDDISKLYILFMLGHELAHLVNKHLEYQDKNKFDSQTIEIWADFFGAKISMLILQNGTKFNKLLNENFNDVNIGTENIFRALVMLNEKVYLNTNNSKKYPNSNDRVSTVIAGISAFLTRKEMILSMKLSEEEHATIGCNWGMAVNRKLFDLGLHNNLFTENVKDDVDLQELMKNVLNIHKCLKQNNRQLLKGLDLYYPYILDTSYEEHRPNNLMTKKFNQKISELGWDIKL